MDIEEYIEQHISAEPEHLKQLWRRTYLSHLYPRMCSGHAQGRLLKMITQMIRPKRIIELGAFTGYSALCFAEGMPPDAVLHAVEIDDEMEGELLAVFQASPWGERIRLHIGDALDVVPAIPEVWDMAFIDANKRQYSDYFQMLVPRMRTGGFIIADNTLWSDKVLDPGANHDAQTRAVLQFNDLIASDPRVEVAILPIRDGMTLIRVK